MNKTKIDRRALLGGLTAALVAPRYSFAASITDATGRTVTAPDRLMRIYPAGPPAAVELYTLAPDLLMGWLEPIGQEEREFLLPESAALPKIPRLTGRDSDDTNLGALASLKPDLILDVGNVDAAYSSLAERVQQQSGIPYVLLDGHLDRIGATYRALGRLIGRSEQAETLARHAETTIATITQRSAEVPNDARPRVYYARDKSGLQTGFGGSMISEPIEFLGAHNVGGRTARRPRCCHDPAGDRLEPRDHRRRRPGIRRAGAQRSGVGGDHRGQERPGLPVAKAAVRLDRLSAGGQPTDRAVVARQDFLS